MQPREREPIGKTLPEGGEWLVLLVFAAASFAGINCYVFPGSNHAITVPFIQQMIDPSLYPNDPLLAERANFHTIYNWLIAWVDTTIGLKIHTTMAVLYIGSLVSSLVAFYRLALVILRWRRAALLATGLFVIGVKCYASVRTLEAETMERTVALPLELLAMSLLFERRVVPAFLSVGIAFLLHPLSGVYCVFAMGCASLWARWPIVDLCKGVALLVVVTLPVTIPRLWGDGPALPFFADGEWLSLLRIRSAQHMDAWSWSWRIHAAAALMFGALVVFARQLRDEVRAAVLGFGGGVAILCVLGTLLVDVVPVTLAVQLQFLRSHRFAVYLGLIVCALGLADRSQWRRGAWCVGLFFFGVCPLTFGLYDLVGLLPFWSALLWIGLARLAPRNSAGLRIGAGVVAVVLGVIGYEVNGGPMSSYFNSKWFNVQRIAKTNSARDAVFLVPPDTRGFRVDSERAVYGEWKDGTQMFFNPEFGKEWWRRMRRLGCDGSRRNLRAGYRKLDTAALRAIAAELPEASEVYALVDAKHVRLTLPLATPTSGATDFRIVRVR